MRLKIIAVDFIHLVLSFVLIASMPAMAQTGTTTVAPLGFAVGKATLKEVKTGVPNRAGLGSECGCRGAQLRETRMAHGDAA